MTVRVCKRGHKVEGGNAYHGSRGRVYCKTCRRENSRKRNQSPRPDEPRWHLYLPVEPFANWLEYRVQRSKGPDEDTSIKAFARRAGVSARVLGQLHNVATVHIDVVDKALIEAGEMYALEEMYPLEGLREGAA